MLAPWTVAAGALTAAAAAGALTAAAAARLFSAAPEDGGGGCRAVWENMVHIFVKTKRLDVTEHAGRGGHSSFFFFRCWKEAERGGHSSSFFFFHCWKESGRGGHSLPSFARRPIAAKVPRPPGGIQMGIESARRRRREPQSHPRALPCRAPHLSGPRL